MVIEKGLALDPFVRSLDAINAVALPFVIGFGVLSLVALAVTFAWPGERVVGLGKSGIIAACLFVVCGAFLGELTVIHVITAAARSEVATVLDAHHLDVRIEGEGPLRADGVAAALRRFDTVKPDHSDKSDARIAIDVRTERGDVRLDLSQDTEDPDNFWVFYPTYRLTRLQQIGHVHFRT